MSDATSRFALPLLLPGQAQKELYHNEALARIDGLLHAAVESATVMAPPADPVAGQCWIVGANASGAWAGRDNELAVWSEGGWRFAAPQPGMLVWNKAATVWIYWKGAAWSGGELPAAGLRVAGVQVVGQRQPPVPTPSGGTTIDAEARAAIAAITAALVQHGLTE